MKFLKWTRRLFAWVLVSVLVLSGCSSSVKERQDTAKESKNPKVLIVYYSASGNTKKAANWISEDVHGDLFEIQPAQMYTREDLDWQNEDSRVNQELNQNQKEVSLKEIAPENWESAEIVFLGYPIWFSEASWVVQSFVKDMNWQNKTVIPFCTSASSPIGNSARELEEMADGGKWLEGQRFQENVTMDEIKEWLESLDLKNL